jgi:hypothetical protein
MNFEQYLIDSEKTLSHNFFNENGDSPVNDMLHATMGILTEVEEILANYNEGKFDIVNISEEIGDIMWYQAIFYRAYPDLVFPDVTIMETVEPARSINNFNIRALKMLDFMKKKIFYNKPIKDEIFKELVVESTKDILRLCNYYHININDVMEINIAKLKARYGEKFSTDKAINRDLTTERNILEGK